MGDDTFGYNPVALPSSIAQYDDYAYGQPIGEYEPTAWGDDQETNIDTMWSWIRSESDERTTALADMWRRVSTLLDATHGRLQRHADALATKWQSPAATSYLEHVGAALYSLSEWKTAADDNARGLDRLASEIARTQSTMRGIWLRYTSEFADAQRRMEDRANDSTVAKVGSFLNPFDDPGPSPDEIRDKYTDEAKPHMQALANVYLDTFYYDLGRGGMYKGPTNAVIASADAGFPGGGPPAPPGGAAAPPAPPLGGAAGTAPAAPPGGTNVPTLAGMVVAPPPPAPPSGLPIFTPTGPAGGPGMPPPLPPMSLPGRPTGIPGTGTEPPARPNLPGTRPGQLPAEGEERSPLRPRPGAVERPNLNGRGRPAGSRPALPDGEGRAAPARPNLRGASRRGPTGPSALGEGPERGGVPRGGRATPGRPAPEESEGRTGRGAGRGIGRGLGGRSGSPERPDLGRSRGRPAALPEEFEGRGRATPPRLSGRRAAGTPREPSARGRGGPFGSRGGAAEAGLGGRRGVRPGGLPIEEQEAFTRRTPQRPDISRRWTVRRGPATAEPGADLAGRRGTAGQHTDGPTPRQGGRRREDAGTPRTKRTDEEGLWGVESPGTGVIDTPTPPAAPDPGSALGRGN